MRFLVDAQLPPVLARRLESLGHRAEHVADQGWFVREVEKGLAEIDAGEVLTHDAVGDRLEQRLAEHQSRR
ncbi:MAG: DUF5615 family PIN-like protein [Vicinamibacterales bacterium]